MSLKLSDLRHVLGRCAALGLAGAIASCGGGAATSHFTPSRIIAFGDETSVIVDLRGDNNGNKYSVNAPTSSTDNTIACASNPLWIQILGNAYGLAFPECNPGPNPVPSPLSRIRAAFGATSADLATQIDAQLAESAFASGDLVTVLVGENDVLQQYTQYPLVSEAQIAANLGVAGAEVGRQVNRLADAGAKVIVATIPDVGITPFALAEKVNNIDTDRAALLTRLSSAFNAAMRSALTNDGRRIGLVLLDEFISAVPINSGFDGFLNSAMGVCDLNQSLLTPPSVLDCTDLTLIPDGSGFTFLWADDRHLSSGAQSTLGSLALSRAQNNPF